MTTRICILILYSNYQRIRGSQFGKYPHTNSPVVLNIIGVCRKFVNRQNAARSKAMAPAQLKRNVTEENGPVASSTNKSGLKFDVDFLGKMAFVHSPLSL